MLPRPAMRGHVVLEIHLGFGAASQLAVSVPPTRRSRREQGRERPPASHPWPRSRPARRLFRRQRSPRSVAVHRSFEHVVAYGEQYPGSPATAPKESGGYPFPW